MNLSAILSLGTAIAGISFAVGITPAEEGGRASWPPASAHVARFNSLASDRGADPVPATAGRPILRAEDGLFYLTAKVNGVPVKFLVDTGANMVVLTPTDAERLGLHNPGSGGTRTMETAAGLSEVRSLVLSRVEVANSDVNDVDAVIMQHGLGVSLLGQNLLSRLGPITMSGDELHIG